MQLINIQNVMLGILHYSHQTQTTIFILLQNALASKNIQSDFPNERRNPELSLKMTNNI